MVNMTAPESKFEIIFNTERTTKNTIRFQEEPQSGEAIIGTLYVQKSFLAKLGNPRKLKVTIEAFQEG